MYRIGILSRPGRTLFIARTEIHKNSQFQVKSYTNAFRAAQGLKAQEYDALVMVTEEFGSTQAGVVQQIKKRFPQLPIVIVTHATNSDLKLQISKYHNAIVLDEKSEVQDIPGVLLKMLKGRTVVNRLSKRFKTGQPVSVQATTTNSIHPSWLFNLADKGAQMRVFGKNLRAGDRVKINVPLPLVNKQHRVAAEIVWVQDEKYEKQEPLKYSQMVGVRFVSI